MGDLFELTLSNMKRLNNVTKMCESINSHSDTALIKVKAGGVYIRLTDFENFCGTECRIPSKVFQYFHMGTTTQWSGKILLDHLTAELRRATRMKQTVTFHVEATQPDILKVRSVHHNLAIKSTNHRPRVFHPISVEEFVSQNPEYGHFRILNAELQKIINLQCVMSGNHGGVSRLIMTPVGINQTDVVFSLVGDCGASAVINIHTHEKSAVVPVHRRPTKPIELMYFLAYLKRSQNMFSAATDLTHIYVSSKGMLIKTESKDIQDPLTAMVFIADISKVDLDSYV